MAILTRLKGIRARKGCGKLRLFNKRPVLTIPVDEREMPIGYQTMLVADECGSLSDYPTEHERTFGYALSVVDRPDVFAGLTRHNRAGFTDEVKASSDPRQMVVTDQIATAGFPTYGFYLEKSEPPEGWREENAQGKMVGILGYAIGSVISDLNGNVYVVVDNHTALRSKLQPMIRSFSHDTTVVDGYKFCSQ